MKNKLSPLKPKLKTNPRKIAGVTMATAASGIKYKNRDDLLLFCFSQKTKVAGVFTKSTTASPAVYWCKNVLKDGKALAIIVNAGIANVFTGEIGKKLVSNIAKNVSTVLNINPKEVLIAQTGVIGEYFPKEKITSQLNKLLKNQSSSSWKESASAIMTTDTFPKYSSLSCRIEKTKVNITGIAKGSGMIAPNMATMLSFIMTDANINHSILKKLLCESVDLSFNSITVDSDTSTSDSVILAATGKAKNKNILDINDPCLDEFKKSLISICKDLSHQIIRDGEGASKFITITVKGAKTNKSAKSIAMNIANSPLIKTALAAGDPNWGRIIMAIGKSNEKINLSTLKLYIGNNLITENGMVSPKYNEEKVKTYLKYDKIKILVLCGKTKSEATVWTCDLTHDYIDINSNYRS